MLHALFLKPRVSGPTPTPRRGRTSSILVACMFWVVASSTSSSTSATATALEVVQSHRRYLPSASRVPYFAAALFTAPRAAQLDQQHRTEILTRDLEGTSMRRAPVLRQTHDGT